MELKLIHKSMQDESKIIYVKGLHCKFTVWLRKETLYLINIPVMCMCELEHKLVIITSRCISLYFLIKLNKQQRRIQKMQVFPEFAFNTLLSF